MTPGIGVEKALSINYHIHKVYILYVKLRNGFYISKFQATLLVWVMTPGIGVETQNTATHNIGIAASGAGH